METFQSRPFYVTGNIHQRQYQNPMERKDWRKWLKAWEENNKKAAKRLMEIVERQERNLETVARIIDFTDSIYGVEGEWTEIGPKRAVKIERSCPLAKQFPPETCTMCFSGSMQGIARGVLGHDKVFCRMPKSLPGGDDCCEIIIEVKE